VKGRTRHELHNRAFSDVRRRRRSIAVLMALTLGLFGLVSFNSETVAQAGPFTVNTEFDEPAYGDLNDNLCRTVNGTCSLRAANRGS
jgi:hypothetical protein